MGSGVKASTSSDEVRRMRRWERGGRTNFGWRKTRWRGRAEGHEGTRRGHPFGKHLAGTEGIGESQVQPQMRRIGEEKVREEHSQTPQTIADGERGKSQESLVVLSA